MAIIYSYPTVIPTANDLVLGTDVDQVDKPTKNFTVQSIIDLVTVSGNDLQAVLNNGNTATQNIVLTGNISATQYTDGTMSITTGVGTGFTSITSTAFVGTLSTAAQPNVTSLGTLTSLKVGNATPNITSIVTSFTAPGDDVKLATTKAIVDYVGTNPPGAESLSATLLVGNTTGATKIEVDNTGSGVDFIDDAKARFGTGNDLEIYHDGSDSYIDDNGTGNLKLRGNSAVQIYKSSSTEIMGEFIADAGVSLYYDNSKKFETLTGGAKVTGNFQATGSGTFVNIINSGTYSDSSGDVGNAGQILSSTGSGTNWINDPNPTPYNWIIEADSGSGSPYTVAQGDTIDFVGVGNVDTAWDNASKELRISLGGTSISGTGADTQVVYWTGAQTVSGDAGMVYNDTSNNLTVSGTVQAGTLSDGTFSGTAGTYTGGVSITSTTFVGALSGNASSATQLASSGAIALTGDTTSTGGPYTYTSGGALNIATSIADTTVTAKVLTNLPTPTSAAIAASDTILAAMAKLQGQITGIPQGLVYKGTWNASTNTPTLASGTGTTGEFYIVSVAGTTNLDGITDWQVGDWAIFVEVGATDTWQKIDNTSAILGSGTANKIAKWTGSNTLATGLISDDGTDVTIGNSGNLIVEGNTTLGNADSDTTTVKGPAHFEEQLRVDEGISLGSNTYGSAGDVLTSGGGSSSVNTWTTPTIGTVTSVTAGTGITIGGTAADPTVGIDIVGTDNAVEVLTAATPASGDLVWFSDINDSNTLRKCTVADLQGPIGGPFLPLAGGTMAGAINMGTNNITNGGTATFTTFSGDLSGTINTATTAATQTQGDNSTKVATTAYVDAAIGNSTLAEVLANGNTTGATNIVVQKSIQLPVTGTNTGTPTDLGVISFGGTYTNGNRIFNDASGGTFRIQGSSNLQLFAPNFLVSNSNGNLISAGDTGAKLYYQGSEKLATTTNGVTITDDLTVDAGASSTINIYKDDAGNGKLSFYNDATQQVYLLHDTGENFYIHGGSGTQILMSSDNATTLTLKTGQAAQLNAYGSGTKTGTAAYNLEVDSSGNIIETPATNPGGKSGTFYKEYTTGTVAAGAATAFTLTRATSGTLVFTVYLTATLATDKQVAKMYQVAHTYGQTPVYNKVIDTGPLGADITVAFADSSNTAVTCSIAAVTEDSQPVGITVIVGHGATAVTFA
jgi:hypothetical protein